MSRERNVFWGGNTDRTLPGVADDLNLAPGIEISGVGCKKGIAEIMVKSGQMGDKLRHERGKSLPKEGDASGL